MPRTSSANASYLVKSKTNFIGNDFVSLVLKAKAFDLQCLVLRHLGVWVFKAFIASAMLHHILHIGLMGAVTQIRSMIVGWVPVFVANLNTIDSRAKKRLSNDQMDSFFNWLVITAKCNRATTLAVHGIAQNSANKFACAMGFVWDNPVKTFYDSKIGNFIKTNVTRNGLPNFLHFFTSDSKKLCVMSEGRLHRNNFSGATLACRG